MHHSPKLLRPVLAPLLFLGLLVILCGLGAQGGCLEPTSHRTVALHLQVRGPAYPRPHCAKGSAAAWDPIHSRGEPVAAALVKLSPGDYEGTTDDQGELIMEAIPEGDYTLTVHNPIFAPLQRLVTVRVGASNLLTITLKPCISAGKNRYRVGFDSWVTLEASTVCGTAWEGTTFQWTQIEGPDVLASIEADGATLRFKTRKLSEVRELPDDEQILSISHDEAGEYVFQVDGLNRDQQVAKDYVLVTSTNVANGMNSVAPYDDFYFVGRKTGPWIWSVTSLPTGWPNTLEGADQRVAWFKPMPGSQMATQQTVVISEKTVVNGKEPGKEFTLESTFSLVVHDWDKVNRDCGRAECHGMLQASWEATRHATTWQRLLDGELAGTRAPGAEACATCHSLGYDRSVPNWGYDDHVDLERITFPEVLQPGNYQQLPQAVKDVSNVYCLACHGPARVDPPTAEQPGRFAVGICARCHDQKPEQDLVAQWKTSRMSRTIKGDQNGPESKQECRYCHSAQGFYYKNFALGRPPSSSTLVMICCENLAPITCQTCHSPMYANNEAQVFQYGAVQTPSGLALKNVGSGALCALCHNTEHDVRDPRTLADRLAPHSPQTEITYGQGGYLLPVDSRFGLPPLQGVACARDAGQGCVTCHMDQGPSPGEAGYRQVGAHTFSMISRGGQPNLRPCQACHGDDQTFDPRAKLDYDGNGKVESVRSELTGLMSLLQSQLTEAIKSRSYVGCRTGASRGTWFKRGFRNKLVVVDTMKIDLGDCDGNGLIEREEQPFLFPQGDQLLHQAAYNYLLVEADKSNGLHNFPFVVKLLQRTILALSEGKNLPAWQIYR